MPTKHVILWRLCDWYMFERKDPMTPDQLFEVFRAVTKARAIPRMGSYSIGKDYVYKIDEASKLAQIASLYRHICGNLWKNTGEYVFDWAWHGHMHEFPQLFTKAEIKEDAKIAAKVVKIKPGEEPDF